MPGILYSRRMKPFASRRTLRSPCLPWLWTLCLALMLRALVPAGTMLEPGAMNGIFPGLVLCPVQNPGLHAAMHHHADDAPQSQSQSCPLCLLAQHAGGSPLPAVLPSLVLSGAGHFIPPTLQVIVAQVWRVRGAPLGSRAPPSFI